MVELEELKYIKNIRRDFLRGRQNYIILKICSSSNTTPHSGACNFLDTILTMHYRNFFKLLPCPWNERWFTIMAARRILSFSSAYIFSVALLSAHFEPLTFPGFLLSMPPPMLPLNWGHNCEVLSQRIGRLTILSGNASNLLMRKLQHPPGIDSEPPSAPCNANANNSILTPSLTHLRTHYSQFHIF